MIKKMPWTTSALILSIAALGNLLMTYSEGLRLALGIFAGVLFILFTIKILTNMEGFKDFVSKPLFMGVFTTYPMALSLLSTYIKPYAPGLGKALWFLSVIGIFAIMIIFTSKFLVKRDIAHIFASTYIVYSGIAVAAITGPAFEQIGLARAFVWIALVGYILITPFAFKRIFKLKTIPEPAIETNAIITAPLALVIAGYNSAYGGSQNLTLLMIMIIISQLIYFFVLTKLPLVFGKPFKPSFAGFTFPIVISAIALKTTNAFLVKSGRAIGALKYLVKFEELVAVIVVAYLCFLFMKVMFSSEK